LWLHSLKVAQLLRSAACLHKKSVPVVFEPPCICHRNLSNRVFFICPVYQASRIIPEKTCAFQTVPVSSFANFGQDAGTVRYVTQLPVRDHHTTTVSGMSLQREQLSNVYFLQMHPYCCKTNLHRT